MIPYLILSCPQGMILIDENGQQTIQKMTPEKYLEQVCLKNGSTLEGREKSFRVLTQGSQKAGVLVNERTHEFWFPTLSRKNENCVWIAYFHTVKAFSCQGNTCEILFDNGMRYSVACSTRTIQMQLKRCRTFLEKINENC